MAEVRLSYRAEDVDAMGGPGEWNGSAFERSPAAEPGSGKP
jgi:hypothetical protein